MAEPLSSNFIGAKVIKATLGFSVASLAYTGVVMHSPALPLVAAPVLTSPLAEWQVTAGYAVFAVSYFVFALGKLPGMKIDRPGMAIIGAVLMVAFRIVPAAEALRFIDFGTLVLLFSMMLLVGYLHLTGFFEWVTEQIVTRLKPRHLLPTVIFITGVLSAFFVNDIICLVMVPFVLLATRRMGLKPLPYLLAVATSANIGSVATITGNPQNMLIGSFSGLTYRHFIWHLGPVALIGLVLDWLIIHRMCGSDFVPGEAEGVEAATLHVSTRELRKPAIVIAFVLAGFIAGVPPPMMAAIGAALMLITRTRNPRLVYDEVDWGLLVFFIGLFLIVGGAENCGVTGYLFDIAERSNLQNAGVFTIVTAVLSNVVSNVPAVMLLKTLVPAFRDPHTGWLVLAMASTLAGNLTITGSVANLIVLERAHGEVHIGFWDYSRVGIPVTLVTLAVGWAWLAWVR
ncbi:MAG: anion transporter [Acidobacteria bacterium]|nr:MAG: anion transporter [Acidobacteriota bacterium]